MRAANKLTAVKVGKLTAPGRYGDGGGLWLQIAAGGTKSWIFRFKLNKHPRQMGLGPVAVVSLAEARELASDARKMLLAGRDPIEARKATRTASRLESARSITFETAAERYITAHEAAWRNDKHRAQWRATLATYAYPMIGTLLVASIDTALVLQILEPIWNSRPETAGRVRGRIEAILDWAAAREYRSAENPARWRGHLNKLLPARSRIRRVKHHAAMPFAEVPAFMAELRTRPFVSSLALQWNILAAARTGETLGARWREVDLGQRVWNIPGERSKSGRPHRVPLTDGALAILDAAPREGDDGDAWLFPGGRAGKPLSSMALLELLRGMRGNGITVHGFRSAFRDWAAECTSHPSEVAEAALAHIVGDKVEAAYRRGDLFDKRRRLMRDWARFCGASER